jgi:hypothetical protein
MTSPWLGCGNYYLPLEGGGRTASAVRVGVAAYQHMLRRCHPTPDCLRQSDPPPSGEGGGKMRSPAGSPL